jgi:signal transduction histidine kinase/CheY-like chemotaxis protein
LAETRSGYLIVPGTIMSFPPDIELRAAGGPSGGPTLRRWFETALSYLVPVAMQADPKQRLQARRVAAFGLAVTCWAPLFAPIYWALGSTRSAWMIVGAAAAILLSTQSLRWCHNTLLAGNLMAASLFSVLVGLATVSGGIQATSLSWLPAVAIIGLLLCDTRSGIAWAVVCCLACGILTCLPTIGVTLMNDIAPQSQWILASSGTCGIVLCALMLTYLFQSSEMKMRRELAAACDQSEQANRAKSTFLANMSHEIRTPLNAVLGMADLMQGTPLSRQQQEYLEITQDSGQALLAVVDDILDFSRIESGRLILAHERFDLHDILLRTLKALAIPAHRKGLELICHIQPDVPRHVVGDASRLRQIVINLVGNGIKFTDEGEVLLRVGLEHQTAGTVVLNFLTSDTGIGVPAERQEVIFQVFEQADNSNTRRFGGFGLGLAITSHLVQAMGGRITVTSEEGRGSTFAFSATFGRSIQDDPTPAEILADRRVLVVEDQSTARHVLGQMLSSLRMQAVFASQSSEAWELIEQADSRQSLFHFVLLDCLLGGDSGYELAERIQRTMTGRVRVVMMLTTDQLPVSLTWCEQVGIQAYLLKPIGQGELLKTLLGEVAGESRSITAADRTVSLAPNIAARSLRVLVAEDSLVNQKLVVGLLKKLGHQAVLANNGREAVEATESQQIDLILMDIQMPEMDGLEATRIIRERERRTGSHTPIIAVTAHVLPEDREKCRVAEMDDYVSKPIRFQTLAAAIERLLPLSASPDTDET